MKFSIITPTYKRVNGLKRAVSSLLSQTYKDWEMIIVNDSPDDISYNEFASSINDPRIRYLVNKINLGVNKTRNYALDNISSDSKWIIFLDDDDFLAPDTLMNLVEIIETKPRNNWIVTNRAYIGGKPITEFPKSDREYSYAYDYLIRKKCRGDVTHCIKTSEIKKIRFSNYIKQGEEWIFFFQLGVKNKMYYEDHNSTITEGYDKDSGLNFRKRDKGDLIADLSKLFLDGLDRRIFFRPLFVMYMIMRFFKVFLKNS